MLSGWGGDELAECISVQVRVELMEVNDTIFSSSLQVSDMSLGREAEKKKTIGPALCLSPVLLPLPGNIKIWFPPLKTCHELLSDLLAGLSKNLLPN